MNVGNTTIVGSYGKGISYYGTYDMAGNVWEWVADRYDANYYSSSPYRNPIGPSSGERGVLRGGSWGGFDFMVRSAHRFEADLETINIFNGFRCARDAE